MPGGNLVSGPMPMRKMETPEVEKVSDVQEKAIKELKKKPGVC